MATAIPVGVRELLDQARRTSMETAGIAMEGCIAVCLLACLLAD